MGLASQSVTIACDKDLNIYCQACSDPLEFENIAMLQRYAPGGEFLPLCIECVREVMRAASTVLDLELRLRRHLN